MFRVDRADTARWIACFVVVVAAHGMAALSLLPSTEASDFDAGAPVVMLELPEASAAPSVCFPLCSRCPPLLLDSLDRSGPKSKHLGDFQAQALLRVASAPYTPA